MEASVSTQELLRTIRNDPDNSNCIDCGRENPAYASISHGSLICEYCFQDHLRLVPDISNPKKLDDPDLSPADLKYLVLGGNARLRNFFSIYQFPSGATIQYKYKTPASHYYREMLRCIAYNETNALNRPNPVEGRTISITQFSSLQSRNSGQYKWNRSVRRQSGGVLSSIRSFFSRSYNRAILYGNSLSERLHDQGDRSYLKTVEQDLRPHMDKLESVGPKLFYGMANLMSRCYKRIRRTPLEDNSVRDSMDAAEGSSEIQIELKEMGEFKLHDLRGIGKDFENEIPELGRVDLDETTQPKSPVLKYRVARSIKQTGYDIENTLNQGVTEVNHDIDSFMQDVQSELPKLKPHNSKIIEIPMKALNSISSYSLSDSPVVLEDRETQETLEWEQDIQPSISEAK